MVPGVASGSETRKPIPWSQCTIVPLSLRSSNMYSPWILMTLKNHGWWNSASPSLEKWLSTWRLKTIWSISPIAIFCCISKGYKTMHGLRFRTWGPWLTINVALFTWAKSSVSVEMYFTVTHLVPESPCAYNPSTIMASSYFSQKEGCLGLNLSGRGRFKETFNH